MLLFFANLSMRGALLAAVATFFSISLSAQTVDELAKMQFGLSSRYTVPSNHAPGFQINLNFPKSLAEAQQLDPGPFPWETLDFRKEPEQYMQAVLAYVVEGNIEADWRIQNNGVRPWFHAPWMHYGRRGREPVRGLTLERRSRAHELAMTQATVANNWAVGFYNALGAVTFGEVWRNPAQPDTSSVTFPVNTVSAKLLFTDASLSEVPFLEDSLIWYADINRNGEPVMMRLLQLDIAVRDIRANNETGWVFGTFMYWADSGNSTPFERLIPVGLMWGNDPNLTGEDYDNGQRPVQGWMNPKIISYFDKLPRKELGFRGRVNGPVDNSRSACLACHGRAMDNLGLSIPEFTPTEQMITQRDEPAIKVFFRNLKPHEPFISGRRSLDYSLQLSDGVANYQNWIANATSILAGIDKAGEALSGEGQLHAFSLAARSARISPMISMKLLSLGQNFESGIGRDEDFAPSVDSEEVLRIEGHVPFPRAFTLKDLALLPHIGSTVNDGSGVEYYYEGVAISALLEMAGIKLGKGLKGKDVGSYLIMESADGFKAVVALPEFDNQEFILADKKDGQALESAEGPLRVIIPTAPRRARWVKSVTKFRIEVAN